MTTPNHPENPKTWLERLLTDETSKKLDTIHPEVVDLFKIQNTDKLDKNTRVNLVDSVTKIATTTILVQFPVNGEMILLHQTSKHQTNKVGGDILNKTT